MLDVYKYHDDPEQLDSYYTDKWYTNIIRVLDYYVAKENAKLERKRHMTFPLHIGSISLYDRTKGTHYLGKMNFAGDRMICYDVDGLEVGSFDHKMRYEQLIDEMHDIVYSLVLGNK